MAETLGYLNACSEEQWQVYWSDAIEPEETVRWITRHEDYHLGQIISYRWLLGDDPYQREA
jgi:hypothetical protein